MTAGARTPSDALQMINAKQVRFICERMGSESAWIDGNWSQIDSMWSQSVWINNDPIDGMTYVFFCWSISFLSLSLGPLSSAHPFSLLRADNGRRADANATFWLCSDVGLAEAVYQAIKQSECIIAVAFFPSSPTAINNQFRHRFNRTVHSWTTDRQWIDLCSNSFPSFSPVACCARNAHSIHSSEYTTNQLKTFEAFGHLEHIKRSPDRMWMSIKWPLAKYSCEKIGRKALVKLCENRPMQLTGRDRIFFRPNWSESIRLHRWAQQSDSLVSHSRFVCPLNSYY